MATQHDEFTPGAAWTPERRRSAIERMLAALASPEMQAAMDAAADDPDPAAAPAASSARPAHGTTPVAAERCVFRRARPADIPRMAQLMIENDLPPLFIEEWLPGFAVVEHEGAVIACGGGELYDRACVIRSIVTDERARGLGLARRITDLLIADARAEGVTDAYLFTVEAHPFWLRLGFTDVSLEDWQPSPRQSWQYWYISTHPGAVAGIHSMWKRIDA